MRCIDDHTLAVTEDTAKDAFAKAIEWHVVEKFFGVSIYDGARMYSIDRICIGNGSQGDCEHRRGRR